jgi:hypothetical protein
MMRGMAASADLVSLRDWLTEWIDMAKRSTEASPAQTMEARAYRDGLDRSRAVVLQEIERRIALATAP